MRVNLSSVLVLALCSFAAACRQSSHEQQSTPVPAQSAGVTGSATIHLSNRAQAAEMTEIMGKISRSGIAKFRIESLEPGTLRDVWGLKSEKKILAWNSAARRLYPSVQAAQADGFAVWEFYPDSQAAQFLDERLKRNGGYSDDLLFILWDGLEIPAISSPGLRQEIATQKARPENSASQHGEQEEVEISRRYPDEAHSISAEQESELKKVIDKITAAGIEKFNIAHAAPGLVERLSRTNNHRMLIWNSAAHRLYPSVEAARADGFAVLMGVTSDSFIAQLFDKEFGEYNDDLLFILWEGLDFTFSPQQRPHSSMKTAPSSGGGWEYAKFGMTAREVIQASRGSARYPDADTKLKAEWEDENVIAVGTYSTGLFHFDVSFLSANNMERLTSVLLKLKDCSRFEALKGSLVKSYGDGQCKKWEGPGISGVPEDYESCIWFTSKNSIQLKYDYTHLQGWSPEVKLFYSSGPEGGP